MLFSGDEEIAGETFGCKRWKSTAAMTSNRTAMI